LRFLVDECSGPALAKWLRDKGHEVFSVYEEARGMDDDKIIQKAFKEDWILITNDKDFGKKVYQEQYPHKGIILLRLEVEIISNKIETFKRLLQDHIDELENNFIVVSEKQIRFASKYR
jgi:predicted nuclease of predicted toxin-antitoxin system